MTDKYLSVNFHKNHTSKFMPDNMITGPTIKNKKISIYFRFPFDFPYSISYTWIVIFISQSIKNEKNASLKRSGNYKIFKTNNDLIVKCPHCLTNIEYESGCYFMTCSSYICKSKKFFCFICQSKLYLSDKKHHFPNGIYNLSCKNKIWIKCYS